MMMDGNGKLESIGEITAAQPDRKPNGHGSWPHTTSQSNGQATDRDAHRRWLMETLATMSERDIKLLTAKQVLGLLASPDKFSEQQVTQHRNLFLEPLLVRRRCQLGECPENCDGKWPNVSVASREFSPEGQEPELMQTWTDCPRRVREKQPEQDNAFERTKRLAEEMRAEEAKEHHYGIPWLYREMRFDTFRPQPGTMRAVAAARDCVARTERGDRGLILCGDVGTGKTHLAVSILQERIAAGAMGWFVSVPELMDRLRFSQNQWGAEQSLLEPIMEADLLVLDDLGAERVTEYSAETIYKLVDSRLTQGRQIVMTTNYSNPQSFAERLGEPTGERLVSRSMQVGDWIVLDAPDYRLNFAGGTRTTMQQGSASA